MMLQHVARMGRYCRTLVMLLSLSTQVVAADQPPRPPAATDKCPVCGMFVVKFSDFAAQIRFRDGSTVFFDGAKDMFKYYLNLTRYNPKKKATDSAAIYVTSYYTLLPINGLSAWYVAGSDIYGPMGRELIPFDKETEAREFMKDHKGKRLLRFRDVNTAVLKGLD